MTVVAVACAFVGALAVWAARDVLLRWMAQRDEARGLARRMDSAQAAATAALAAHEARMTERLDALEGDVRALRDREREERLARIGARR